MKKQNFSQGFTFIEVMIVVVIVALLIAIAIPSYRYLMVKTYESNVKAEMRRIAIQLEAYRSKNLTYAGFILENKNVRSTDRVNLPYGSGTNTYNYQIRLTENTATNSPHSLENEKASGQSWKITARPNPNRAAFLRGAKSFLMTSTGLDCERSTPYTHAQRSTSC